MNSQEADIDQIKSIYYELVGYLLACPEIQQNHPLGGFISTPQLWNNFNAALDRLNNLTSSRYSTFSIYPDDSRSLKNPIIAVNHYKSNLYGLIFKLHADYFPNDPPLLSQSESGNIVFNQSIRQEQSVSINIFKEQIDEKIAQYEAGTNQRNFLEKLKEYLATTNNVSDILRYTFNLAQKLGLNLDDIMEMFS